MKIKSLLQIFLLPVLLASPAGAIELSLEENRAEQGSIGYVDIQRLFKAFPDMVRARENFEEVVKQAEDQINMRKVELIKLRNELSQLKIERDFMAKTPMMIPKKQDPPPPEPKPAALNPIDSLPGFAAPPSTAAAQKTESLAVNIPGVSTAPIVVQPPAPKAAEPAPAAVSPLADMDAKIAAKASELIKKESSFREEQASTEKNLLDLESRKTEILLGKIYRAVQDVARKEGVGVVVDKGNILYGHDAIDLTAKVLKFLKSS
ncbi:MAG: hypothetical protein A3J74_05310 [Elusimicrobia bacterium RIFCSPHIGHO2_02_FULL_57_9]|nr:MAG: hypothetical protein A3J74_05310 [Elusimicrobia bacterium RIFCSPHIGHO2_02_FULL_57_9]